jgi:hypothetical protein
MNKPIGSDIKSLLFGKEIKGRWFWWARDTIWRQERTVDGAVKHFGWQIHPYVLSGASGVGRIENGMLFEQWNELPRELEICVVIFRVTEPLARGRWGDYVMVTGSGPQPFKVIE